jgi:hypothetical protein
MDRVTKIFFAVGLASSHATHGFAATPDQAEQAIARAIESAKVAASLKNQWTTTTQALDEAEKASMSGEERAWKDAVIK